ncbi:Retrovirus-related Pol polyprotein from transposon TNT 1-94 [Gossypium australe]|uniref:Retrovirus-related Pol polyprotein from transposon TNT 1-94 n=1 Tax=Gossypium australe TaxID=47621 RepID=A0A5B6W760_9ROSI|nr:Retrovirus-related Pol polyprotein from transposon TNT 1-94 [Gossypium australe]
MECVERGDENENFELGRCDELQDDILTDNIDPPTPPNRPCQSSPEETRWTQAMAEEMTALEKNATWDSVLLPDGKEQWGVDGYLLLNIKRFKVQLVAKGYTQSYGVDYQETFAPVAKLDTIRVLLSLALIQFDFKNAFLQGDLVEEVYMDPPLGIEKYLETIMVCKLEKALYGLKQSPRAWFGRFMKSISCLGTSKVILITYCF